MSKLIRPGPVMMPFPAFPKKPNGACTKAAVLNHSATVLGPLSDTPDTRLGRVARPGWLTLSIGSSENPLWMVVLPVYFQPASTACFIPVVRLKNGSDQTWLKENTWPTLKSEFP